MHSVLQPTRIARTLLATAALLAAHHLAAQNPTLNVTIQGSGANNATNPVILNWIQYPGGPLYDQVSFPVALTNLTYDPTNPTPNTHRVVTNNDSISVLVDPAGGTTGQEVSATQFATNMLTSLQDRDLNSFVDIQQNSQEFSFRLQFAAPQFNKIAYFERGGAGTNSWLVLRPIDASGNTLPGGRSFLMNPDSGFYVHRAAGIPAANTAGTYDTTRVVNGSGTPVSAPSNSLVVATWTNPAPSPTFSSTQILGFYDIEAFDLFDPAATNKSFTYLEVSLPQDGTTYFTRAANSTVVSQLTFSNATNLGDPRNRDLAPDFTIFALVPEPSTYAALAGGLALAVVVLARRRRA